MRMHLILEFLVAASCVYLLPYFISMLVTSVAAVVYLRSSRRKILGAPPESPTARRFLFVIPAHNEEVCVAATVRSCRAVQYPSSHFDVLVIADNCTDDTAGCAAKSGARVLERFDATRRSKGYAIEFLIETLMKSGELDALDALVFVDADSIVDGNILEEFALGLDRGCCWMQCYDCVGNADRSWRTKIMAYGFSLLNGITLAGRKALGLSASLRGNGMCISTAGLRQVPWNAHGLVEDLEYSWLVRSKGHRIDFIEDTSVHATMLSSGGTPLINQRRRWEFGRIAVRRRMIGPLFHSPHLSWSQKAIAIEELTSHPTSHMVIFYLLLSVCAGLLISDMILEKQFLLLTFICISHAIATLALFVHALSPFITSLIPWRFAASFVYFPYYIFWRLRVLAKGGPPDWIPTPRERDSVGSRTISGELAVIPPFHQVEAASEPISRWRT
jgi:cellulose synthase/poly-beta-1,6-N-acetylglucosamine synthase-like glycosyltransferase